MKLKEKLWISCTMVMFSYLLLGQTSYAEYGTTTATRIQREEHSESISVHTENSTTQTTESSTHIGVGVPSINISIPNIVIDKETLSKIDVQRRNALASYKATYSKTEDRHFQEHGYLARIKKGKKWGIVGTDGQLTMDPTYKILIPKENGVLYVGNKKKELSYVDGNNNPVTYEKKSEDALIPFKEKGLYGFKDSKGHIVIKPVYKRIVTEFSEGIAFVITAGGHQIAINTEGTEIFNAPYEVVMPFQYGVAEYRRSVNTFKGSTFLSSIISNIIYDTETDRFNSYTPVYNGIKRGYLNHEGEIVIDSKNDVVYPMTPYGTIVQNNGLTSFITADGQVLIPPGHYTVGSIHITDGYLVLRDDFSKKYGVFELIYGKQVVPFLYDDIQLLGQNRFIAKHNYATYLVDSTNGRLIATLPVNQKAVPFDDGEYTWIFMGSSNFAIIDSEGHIVFRDSDITDAGPFKHGYSPVKKNKKWGVIDTKGTWIIEPQYDDVEIL